MNHPSWSVEQEHDGKKIRVTHSCHALLIQTNGYEANNSTNNTNTIAQHYGKTESINCDRSVYLFWVCVYGSFDVIWNHRPNLSAVHNNFFHSRAVWKISQKMRASVQTANRNVASSMWAICWNVGWRINHRLEWLNRLKTVIINYKWGAQRNYYLIQQCVDGVDW